MKRNEKDAAIPSMSGQDILNMIPGIENIADIKFLDFSMIPGPHITPENMQKLSLLINNKLENENYDGVVVTHGTDSLEETAYFVDLTYNGSKPVVFVGAMRNSSELGWDGPSNLINAVYAAISDESKDRGVMVVMNEEIHAASQVTKTNTHTLDTFKSLNCGPIGFIENRKAHFYYGNTRRQYIPAERIHSNIDIIKCACGMDDHILRLCVDYGVDGIVIEGMGRGNIPPKMVSGVEYALSKNIPVVLVSRCFMGRVFDDYGYEGGGRELTQKGVILGGNLSGQKARIKLMLALGYTKDLSEIKEIFEKQYY